MSSRAPAPQASGAVGERVAVTRYTVRAGRPAMGTLLELSLVMRDPDRGQRAADVLFTRVMELERLFTTYAEDSALNRLSDAAGRGAQPVDIRMARILGESLAYTRRSGGAFDITVGPLVELWSRSGASGRVPSDAEIAATLLRVGPSGIHIRNIGPTVELKHRGMRLDLGGIAKGWALDRLGEVLVEGGVRDALLDFGQSSILALGKPLDAPAWTVALRAGDEGVAGIVSLRDGMGFSVSGALGRYFEIDGVRYGHVIDPRNGRALIRNVQAAVVAPDATAAEVWSTALTVLGPEGLARIEAEAGVEAHLLLEDGSSRTTSGWAEATAFEPTS